MASALRPTLLRHAFQQRAFATTSSALPAFRSQLVARRTPALRLQKAPFQTTAIRPILPPLPQVMEGDVNKAATVPEPEPSHGSYHWTAER